MKKIFLLLRNQLKSKNRLYQFLGRICKDSYKCQRQGLGFCNLRNSNSGYCIRCPDIDGRCDEDNVVATGKALQECQSACEKNKY